LFHINTFPDDPSMVNTNSGSLGFYTAYGESDPVVKVNIDIDQAVAVIVNKIVEAIAAGATAGGSATVTTAIPDFNPLDIGFGLDSFLEMVEVPKTARDEIAKFLSLDIKFEAADLDAYATANFSQEFALSIDDMSYMLTLENGFTQYLTANGINSLLIDNASSYDVDGNGIIDYSLQIIPDASFYNDTEVGLSLGYTLDFLKGELAAGVSLPIGDLLLIDSLPSIPLPALDLALGPMLEIKGDLDILNVDIFETQFNMDIGTNTFTGGVSKVDDIILGSNAIDNLFGYEGNDQINGGAGADIISGGAGDDLFVFETGTGSDTVTDFIAGAGTDDVIDLIGIGGINSFADVQASTTQNGGNAVIDLNGGDEIILVGVNIGDLHKDDFLV
jgi:Ca2+-binding RTX toxin-like protein